MVAASSIQSMHSDIATYLQSTSAVPFFIRGDSKSVLNTFPDACIDMCMTSPPYWSHRVYAGGGLGREITVEQYIEGLLDVFAEVRRVLKPTGSFWLNLGDTYSEKRLVGIPWRVALRLTDTCGWVLRNEVIWNKVKGGPDTAKDKLRNVHEHVFHFVKEAKGYFYDVDAIRKTPGRSRIVNGSVVSATGVSGVRYKRQIELSTSLGETEKQAATDALEAILAEVRAGSISDFRMIIRGQQRATHSDESAVSGRARELVGRGFYFLKYHPNGSKPGDVWDIIPEDTQGRDSHFAPYPEDLCRLPIHATCPPGGVVLDPFCGTGTTMRVAHACGRKSVGIDVADDYIAHARERCSFLL